MPDRFWHDLGEGAVRQIVSRQVREDQVWTCDAHRLDYLAVDVFAVEVIEVAILVRNTVGMGLIAPRSPRQSWVL